MFGALPITSRPPTSLPAGGGAGTGRVLGAANFFDMYERSGLNLQGEINSIEATPPPRGWSCLPGGGASLVGESGGTTTSDERCFRTQVPHFSFSR